MSILENAQMMVQYKAWSNNLMYTMVSSLSIDEQTKLRKTTFGSILSTLNHIHVIDTIFQCHLMRQPHNHTARNTENHPEFPELWEQQKKMDTWYIDYVSSSTEEEFLLSIAFEFTGGGKGLMSPNQIILHLVNHATYHNGYISDMMYHIPVTPPTTDLTVFLRDEYKYPA